MNGRTDKYLIALALFMLLPQPLLAESLWSDVSDVDVSPTAASAVSIIAAQPDPHKNSRRVSVSYDQLTADLANAGTLPAGGLAKSPAAVQLNLPMPDGGLQTFNVYETSVMAAELAARYPQIKTYKAIAESDAGIRGVLNIGPNGFRGYLFTPDGEVFIDPVPDSDQQYYSYYKRDYGAIQPGQFSCGVKTESDAQSPLEEFKSTELVTAARTSIYDKISYRIAVAATGEYSQKVGGGDVTNTLDEINKAISRINEIFERDLAIQLQLVANNSEIIFTDAENDPYTDPSDVSLLLGENQVKLDAVIKPENYDIGHVLSTSGGGLAGLGVACRDDNKARGASGHPEPSRDPFYIDILAHEIGHQLGANHSFNGTTLNCAGDNRNAATAFEPGSGTTIMAYAGICGDEDVQRLSDATFHAGSIAEIISYTRTGYGSGCASDIVGSQAPVVNAGSNYTIPGGTAFALTGSASDAVTYQWDQMDVGDATTATTYGTDLGNNALFRSFEPAATPVRIFPQLTTQLSNTPDKAETLPIENRTLNFRLTVRDGNGGVAEADMQVAVNANTGPFKVLQPNASVILDWTQPQSIQWNAACTEQLPVSCANVDILLSTDAGTTFSSLVGGITPNDGVEIVSLPNINTNNARIKITCTSNIFFDISDVDFAISTIGGGSLPTDIIGGSYDCGTATVIPSPPPSSGGGGTLNVYWLLLLLVTPLLRLARPLYALSK